MTKHTNFPVLASLAVDEPIRDRAAAAVSSPECLSAMLYGSFARGDNDASSDLDVLRLVSRAVGGERAAGMLSITDYSRGVLRRLAVGGSLFVLHLRREGKIIYDHDNCLQEILDTYRHPSTYEPLLRELRSAVGLLSLPPAELVSHEAALIRVAKFLLRTELYRRCAELGEPMFSRQQIRDKLHVGWIDELLASGSAPGLDGLRQRLEAELGVHSVAPKTLQTWASTASPFVAHLAASVLAGGTGLDYAAGTALIVNG